MSLAEATASAIEPRPAFGVERSALGRRWVLADADPRLVAAIAQRHTLPEPAARILAARGIGLESVRDFLEPRLRSALPDPSVLRDMETAADRITAAVMAQQSVAVFADYDVDGATSGALLARLLRACGLDPLVYIPDRLTEGYGPNPQALERLARQGVRLVVTVDCGVTAFEALEAAAAAGLEVVVIDHHAAEASLPKAVAVVNPNRLDEGPDGRTLRHLAAVGVVFLLAVAVLRRLRRDHWFTGTRAEPDLLGWLDLVALGTVCDVVPLTGLNRAYVAQGLKVMARRGNTGLAALADVAKLSQAPEAYHLGYVLGPRINAGGRVAIGDLGARLLATEDTVEAARIARLLEDHNEERRAIEAAVLAAALVQAERRLDAADAPVLLVADEGWHPGVIGIVAGRLKERFTRPAVVVSLDGAVGKGSGRSIAAVDLGAAVVAARAAGLLVAGGGHKMACGFTVERERLDALGVFLAEHASGQLGGRLPAPVLDIDAAATAAGAGMELARTLALLGPYGAGHPEPRIAVPDVRVVKADPVGGNHLQCILSDAAGGRLRAIAFNVMDGPLGRLLTGSGGRSLHVAGVLTLDGWNGTERVRLRIEDAAVAGR